MGRVRVFSGLSVARVLPGLRSIRFCTRLTMAGVLTGLGRVR